MIRTLRSSSEIFASRPSTSPIFFSNADTWARCASVSSRSEFSSSIVDPQPHVVDAETEQRHGEDSGPDRGALQQQLGQLEAADGFGVIGYDDQ